MNRLMTIMDELVKTLDSVSADLSNFLPNLILPAVILIVCLTVIGMVTQKRGNAFTLTKVAIALGVIVFAAYAASLNNAFHFDDSHSVENNIAVRSMTNIPSFWTDPQTSSFIPENRVYRPLVYTFYSVCWFIGKGATWPFHLMKMFMQMLVALAIFAIWRRLWSAPGWFPVKGLRIKLPMISQEFNLTAEMAAFFLAVIFAVHPANSECVVYIAATTSLQAAVFYVWAFYHYLQHRDTGLKKHLFISLGLYFLSVASKEEGITLPVMVLVTELFLNKGTFFEGLREGIRKMIPYAGLGLVLALWIVAMRPASGDESRGYVSSYHYFITQWRSYLWYMRLWFWPWDLNADVAAMEYSKSIVDPLVIQAAIGNLLLVGFAWLMRRRTPAMLFGMLWFYITIAPASSVVVLAEAINEHRMYLSYVGFVGGTFVALLYFAEIFMAPEGRIRPLGAAYAFALFGLLIGTQDRNHVWTNAETLWTDTLAKNPTSGRAMNNLALVYMSRGDFDKSVSLLNDCEKYWSSYMYCSLNKGISFGGMAQKAEAEKKPEEAKKYYDLAEASYLRAYSLNPHSVHINFQMGRWFEETRKDYKKATEYFRTAVLLTGERFPEADLHLMNCFVQLKQIDNARGALNRALAAEPHNELVLFSYAKLEFENGNPATALSYYEKLLEVNPRHVQGWYNYGVVLVARNEFSRAREAFQHTVTLDPNSEQGWFNLAFANEKLGKKGEALDAARKLASIAPANPDFQKRVQELERK